MACDMMVHQVTVSICSCVSAAAVGSDYIVKAPIMSMGIADDFTPSK